MAETTTGTLRTSTPLPVLAVSLGVVSIALVAAVAGVVRSAPGSIAHWAAPLGTSAFWASQLIQTSALYGVAAASGLLVTRLDVKVNYTRKINHFALFFIPIFLRDAFAFEATPLTYLVGGLLFVAVLGTYIEPIRSRVPLVAHMFRSFDRPEDRPHTLAWLSTQTLAGYMVLIPLLMVLSDLGVPELIYIPILINAVGDGLAEPVGVKFGRRRYSVPALFTAQRYTRTLEGSACVLLSGIAVVLLFGGAFSTVQLVAALLVVPLAMTLAEAFSPHTWDTPFLFLTGGLAVIGIVMI